MAETSNDSANDDQIIITASQKISKVSQQGQKVVLGGFVLPPLKNIKECEPQYHLNRDEYIWFMNQFRDRTMNTNTRPIPILYDHEMDKPVLGSISKVEGSPDTGVYVEMEVSLSDSERDQTIRDGLIKGHISQLSMGHRPKYGLVGSSKRIPLHEVCEVSLVHQGARPKCYIANTSGLIQASMRIARSEKMSDDSTDDDDGKTKDISNVPKNPENPFTDSTNSNSNEQSETYDGWFLCLNSANSSTEQPIQASMESSSQHDGQDSGVANSMPPPAAPPSGSGSGGSGGAYEHKPGMFESEHQGTQGTQGTQGMQDDEPAAKRFQRAQPNATPGTGSGMGSGIPGKKGEEAMTEDDESDREVRHWSQKIGAYVDPKVRELLGTNTTDAVELLNLLSQREIERDAEAKRLEREATQKQFQEGMVQASHLISDAKELHNNGFLDDAAFTEMVQPLDKYVMCNASLSSVTPKHCDELRQKTGVLTQVVKAIKPTATKILASHKHSKHDQALQRMFSSNRWEAQRRQATEGTPMQRVSDGAAAGGGGGGGGSGSGSGFVVQEESQPVNASMTSTFLSGGTNRYTGQRAGFTVVGSGKKDDRVYGDFLSVPASDMPWMQDAEGHVINASIEGGARAGGNPALQNYVPVDYDYEKGPTEYRNHFVSIPAQAIDNITSELCGAFS